MCPPPNRRSDERGMTLVELLVATSAGMTLFLGLTMMVMGSMHQTTRVTNRVHSTAKARTALHKITSELHSSCVARYLTPIQEGATGSELRFVRAYSAEVAPNPVESRSLPERDHADPVRLRSPGRLLARLELQNDAVLDPGDHDQRRRRSPPACRSSATTPTPKARFPRLARPFRLNEERAEKIVKVDIAMKVTTPGATVTDAKGAAQVQDSAPAALHAARLQHHREQPAMRMRNRIRSGSESGFTMVATLVGITVMALLAAGHGQRRARRHPADQP